ncbi:MAG: protoporphyrinogen oxidase HemJ [Deltaproteobacteria bacterium]|nr:protoporphyrinogen oxidase HemJ [Deltaproteobacteria bacterium]
MVAWFAGLFYIFRLFVYHAKFQGQAEMRAAYQVMEKKLLYIIMHPAMLLTLILGVLLISQNPSVLRAPWFHVKLLAVAALIAYQIFAGIVAKRFARGDFFLSEKACRMINEIPTLLLVVIVIMVVVKPWS